MIPMLSVMIGAYIVTRMVDLLTTRLKSPHGLVVVLAVLTIFVALWGMVGDPDRGG
jgi:predicted PurR-regulated permease PerM